MITPQTRRQASQIFNETHSDSDDIGDGIDDMRSPLDRTIDKIGMGPYQWALLGLCGFGHSCPESSTVAPETSPSSSLVKIARILLPRGDDSGNANTPQLCDVTTQNKGWKYLLGVLGIITLVMFVLRIIFFRLYESPRYLVAAGREAEAVTALQSIEDYNMKFGRPSRSRFVITLADVCDTKPSAMLGEDGVVFDAGDDEEANVAHRPSSRGSNEERKSTGSDSGKEDDRTQALSQQPADRADYRSTSQSPEGAVGQGWNFHTPMPSNADENTTYFEQKTSMAANNESEASTPGTSQPHGGRRLSRPPRPHMRTRSRSSVYVEQSLPSTFARPIVTWLDRVSMLFTPEWRLTTILIWCAWWGMSLAFTMFNVYLPKLLEKRLGDAGGGEGSRKEALWDIVIFTLGGCPGALIGAWMIESPLGRRKSLALSTFITAICCLAFVQVESKTGVVWSTIGVSLASAIMWAVLYGMTPEIFDTKIRGTACGTASALNRVGGMIAPVAGGILLDASPAFPVYASIVVFLFSVVCVLLLPFEKCPTPGKDLGSDDRGEYTALH
ncbi:putative MFS-type transporter PB1E7,08c [Rhizoctonia solani AG-1 IB]|uniref:Putative MFS-type transporter PB1E7,08c n=1 Tax=Thanatephorus cucumeris (strain AG1-IB / isolate 7/3/14) TaxID=1108050 RepID=M5BP43_THACB|nr:putative MFS-type transporter PB1E7,08c [Rhizoctonia solani AG-1 IB]